VLIPDDSHGVECVHRQASPREESLPFRRLHSGESNEVITVVPDEEFCPAIAQFADAIEQDDRFANGQKRSAIRRG
jgi:hypothetical protein